MIKIIDNIKMAYSQILRYKLPKILDLSYLHTTFLPLLAIKNFNPKGLLKFFLIWIRTSLLTKFSIIIIGDKRKYHRNKSFPKFEMDYDCFNSLNKDHRENLLPKKGVNNFVL